jgi:hypothetical protein
MNARLPLACALLLAAGAAHAQSPAASSVDVLGKAIAPPRAPLQQACPQALSELPDALAATAQDVATASTVTVRFEIDGGTLHAMQVEGGVGRQARAVRKAVRNLGCSNGSAGRQLVQFQVRFLDPFARRPEGAVALLDLAPR